MPLVRLVLMYPNGTKEPHSALDFLLRERPVVGDTVEKLGIFSGAGFQAEIWARTVP